MHLWLKVPKYYFDIIVFLYMFIYTDAVLTAQNNNLNAINV